MTKWLAILAAGLPMLVLLGVVFIHHLRRRKSEEGPPLHEKLLRPPGHSISLEIDRRWSRFFGWSVAVGICSIGFALVVLLAIETGNSSQYAPALFLLAPGVVVFIWLAWIAMAGIRPLRLDLLGQQAVAGQLQGLARDGYRVFHDVSASGRGSIDHVVVGPAGVFALETKCRLKRPSANDLPDHEAVFDGRTIHFPWCTDEKAAGQAERNAKWLGKWLSKAVGHEVSARPVVVLPGWYVKLKTDSQTRVVGGKQLPELIVGEPARLNEELARQIADRLEERCRDVDF